MSNNKHFHFLAKKYNWTIILNTLLFLVAELELANKWICFFAICGGGGIYSKSKNIQCSVFFSFWRAHGQEKL